MRHALFGAGIFFLGLWSGTLLQLRPELMLGIQLAGTPTALWSSPSYDYGSGIDYSFPAPPIDVYIDTDEKTSI
ncbi:MAG: hypothetical protein JWO43_487 [Candidatus Adlerbacteria bacterium]|nr:hypothetical protein [Candidatus Adlerbacteria bacterium]